MNPNSIPWLHYQDIQSSDKSLRDEFNSYMNNGQYTEAISLLKDNTAQLKGKAYIADTINKVVTGVLELENKFNTDVTVFLSDLAVRYNQLIDNLKIMGDWNVSVKYTIYNFVMYNREVYMAIKQPPVGFAPANQECWLKIGLKGLDGAPGVDLEMKYGWLQTKKYSARDLVSYDGNIYFALKANQAVVPGTDRNIWLPFITTAKGKIEIGINAPANPILNMVWFKTDTDPLIATSFVQGVFQRYSTEGVWEIMYPATLFNYVDGLENFAPSLTIDNIVINDTDWQAGTDEFVYQYTNSKITNSSVIEIILDNNNDKTAKHFYSLLKIRMEENGFVLLVDAKASRIKINLTIKIQ